VPKRSHVSSIVGNVQGVSGAPINLRRIMQFVLPRDLQSRVGCHPT
jgi:hypothetical protein